MHLVVVEEAHNVLTRPKPGLGGSGNPQEAAAELFGNMDDTASWVKIER